MTRCEAEMCRNWTGQGCACEFLGLEPDIAECECCGGDPNEVCDMCGEHECWAGTYMCENHATASSTTRGRWEER